MQLTNKTDVPLLLAGALAHDDYDYQANVISATGLVRPLRQIVLTRRIKPEDRIQPDVVDKFAVTLGSAIHAFAEQAWSEQNYERTLTTLGFPKNVIDNVAINPTEEYLNNNAKCIPIYIEQRTNKYIDGFEVSGKYDAVMKGQVNDIKSASVYGWTYRAENEDKFRKQMSIYRWLNPKIITADFGVINYFFKDWTKGDFLRDTTGNYPSSPAKAYKIALMSIADTEAFIKQRLSDIKRYSIGDQSNIPLCSDAEIGIRASTWKYYKDPIKTSRSTKNYTNSAEAFQRLANDGNVGIVKEVKAEPFLCKYCEAAPICNQAQGYVAQGILTTPLASFP